jgi:steroid 5-alpha reductase family enzyme
MCVIQSVAVVTLVYTVCIRQPHMDILEQTLTSTLELHTCICTEKLFWNCALRFDAIVATLWVLALVIVYSFVWSIVGRNCSKVDQIWSVTPWVYGWLLFFHFYFSSGMIHNRLLVMCVLMTLWGLRLTFNFWRRGGYGNLISHEEDYRWPILRAKIHPALFLVFNLVFIASYQNILLWLIAMPAYVVLSSSNPEELMVWDIVLSFIFLSLLAFETIADQQHYNFQQYKYSLSPAQRSTHSDNDIREGFLQSGLWALCRHPNYFAEQSIWICVYLFSLVTTLTTDSTSTKTTLRADLDIYMCLNWSCAGWVLLVMLFQGSMAFGESITASKYPEYTRYQRCVSQCIPWGRSKAKAKTK